MAEMADLDPVETSEWVDSLRAVLHHRGSARATYLLEKLTDEAQYAGATRPFALNTPYVNTIPPEREERPKPPPAVVDNDLDLGIGQNAPNLLVSGDDLQVARVDLHDREPLDTGGVREHLAPRP